MCGDVISCCIALSNHMMHCFFSAQMLGDAKSLLHCIE
jgi:hypothetical protein